MRDPNASLRLEYRLAETDVRRYSSSGRARRCLLCCRRRMASFLVLVALGCFLVAICHHAAGVRSSAIALATTLAALATLAWTRQARLEGRILKLARQVGLPRDVRLVISSMGIAAEPGPGSSDPARNFAWSEVSEVSRVDHLTVIHLRPAGGVLIVPDAAFTSQDDRAEFEGLLQAWHREAGSFLSVAISGAATGPGIPG